MASDDKTSSVSRELTYRQSDRRSISDKIFRHFPDLFFYLKQNLQPPKWTAALDSSGNACACISAAGQAGTTRNTLSILGIRHRIHFPSYFPNKVFPRNYK